MPSFSSLDTQDYIAVVIQFFNEEVVKYRMEKDSSSRTLFDFVCKHVGINEKEYFGLRFKDAKGQRRWLSLKDPLLKQLRNCQKPFVMYFRIMLYPIRECLTLDGLTLHLLVSQVRKDFEHGRVLCSLEDNHRFVAQLFVSKYANIQKGGAVDGPVPVKELKVFDVDTAGILAEVNMLRGLLEIEAASIAIDRMREIGCLGLDPHPYKDNYFASFVGLYPTGFSTVNDLKVTKMVLWSSFCKIVRNGCKVVFTYTENGEKRSLVVVFEKKAAAKHLEQCVHIHAEFYGSKAAHLGKIRRTWTTVLRRKSFKSSLGKPSRKSLTSPLVDEAFESTHNDVVTGSDSRVSPMAHSFATTDSKPFVGMSHCNDTVSLCVKSEPLALDGSSAGQSLCQSTVNTVSTNVSPHGDATRDSSVISRSSSKKMTISQSLSFVALPSSTITTFQMGLLILVMTIVSVFILIAFK